MSITRIIAIVAAIVLGVAMLLLLFVGPSITYDTHDARGQQDVNCGSVIGQGTGSGTLLDEQGGGLQDNTLPPSLTKGSQIVTAGINEDCDQRRTARAALVGVLAVPTSVLAMTAVTSRRREQR